MQMIPMNCRYNTMIIRRLATFKIEEPTQCLINCIHLRISSTVWKVYRYRFFYGPNTGKYKSEISPYLDTFHAMQNRALTLSILTKRLYKTLLQKIFTTGVLISIFLRITKLCRKSLFTILKSIYKGPE